MKLDAFTRQLRETGSYETPAGSGPALLDRVFPNSSALYYRRIFGIVFTAYACARAGRFDERCWAWHSHATIRAVEKSGVKVRIDGLIHRVRDPRPVVYVANHMSMLETFTLACCALPFTGLATVIKSSLLDYPMFGPVMRATDPIAVTRQDPRQDLRTVLEQGEARLRQGRSCLIFPQATRNPVFVPSEFNSLGVKLAGRAGVPVVPVALKTDFMGIGKRLRDFGPIDISKPVFFQFGEPIAVEKTGRDAHRQVVEFVTRNLKQWGAVVRDAAPGSTDHDAAGSPVESSL